MPFFWKPYTSDVTNFIQEMKAKNPTLEAEQRAGRALLWDRSLDRSSQADWQDAVQRAVPEQGPAGALLGFERRVLRLHLLDEVRNVGGVGLPEKRHGARAIFGQMSGAESRP